MKAERNLRASKTASRVAVGSFFFLCGVTFASWASRIPTVKESFRLNEAELGSILFLLPLGSLCVLLLSGWSISRFGSRRMTLISAIGYACMLIALAACSTVLQLSVALFFFGFTGNLLNIAMNTQALEVQEHIYQRPIMSSFHGLWSFGAMFGALVGGWMMAARASMFTQFAVISVCMVVVYIIAYLYLVSSASVKTTAGFAWPSSVLWILGIIGLCCEICEGAMADWSSLYYQEVVNTAGSVSTTGYTAFALTMALGRLAGDKLIDRFGSRQILLIDAIIIIAGLSIGIGIVHPLAVVIGFAMIGIGVSTIIPIVYTLAGKSAGNSPSMALSTVTSIGYIGFMAGPPVIGYIAHTIGLRGALLLLIVMPLTIVLLSRKVR